MAESEWEKYVRTGFSEMRKVNDDDIVFFESFGHLDDVSISDADLENGSPKEGDMIARNPENHDDKWLVAEKYFRENFRKLESKFPEKQVSSQGIYTQDDVE